jgi:putative DNA primase/helicase
MTDDRTRYDALVEIVAEYFMQGQQPNPAWLDEINNYRAHHPEWIPPPPVVIPPPAMPPPPPAPSNPRAAVPLKPGRVLIELESDAEKVQRKVLAILGARLCVFQNAGKLVELQVDPGKDMPFLTREVQAPRMLAINSTRAWSLATEHCAFGNKKVDKNGTESLIEVMAPEWIGRTLTSRSSLPNIRVFSGLAQAPTLRHDGALIWESGYDPTTGIYLLTDIKVTMPENPTVEDARASLNVLLDLVTDFDFSNPAGRTAWLSGLLSVVCRHTFDGPAPLVIIDATKRGSGKTMLADLASVIATGSAAPRMFFVNDEIEMDKRISALGISGDQMVLIDNITGTFASAPLDAALTSTSYRGRVLGKSEMTPALSMKIVWFATGNGMIVGGDIARRALLARLEPTVDRPEDRTGPRPGQSWKYPNLLGYAKRRRADLLTHVLTIISAYIRAGRPNMGLTPMGSFEDWSDTIRSAIVFAGGCDPVETTQDVREADMDDIALRTMVECWPVADGVQVTAAALIDWATITPPMSLDGTKREHFERTRQIREMWRNALLEWLPARKGDLPTARELGEQLKKLRGAIIGDYKIKADERTNSGIPWSRVRIAGGGTIETPNGPSQLSIVK